MRQVSVNNSLEKTMSANATYAFVLINDTDWRLSTADDYDWQIVEIEGTEKTLGHHKIDGAIYRVLHTSNDQVVAITK
jgi:hypothetical protein